MIRIKEPSEVPNGPHYQVMVYETRTVYEDTGYGESYPTKIESFQQWVTEDLVELNVFIKSLETQNERSAWPKVVLQYSVVQVNRKFAVSKEIVLS